MTPYEMLERRREKVYREMYVAWKAERTPAELERHERLAAADAANKPILDFRHQFEGTNRRVLPCEACGVKVSHCGIFVAGPDGEFAWRVSQDHQAPCGRPCILSSEASHYGGQTMRPFANSPDCHRGHLCLCQKKPPHGRPVIKIPTGRRRPIG